ncbi:MAG: T9SS type A sorting domain-containing protein [Candidatus Cloacimonetes bacterium]|nr:T9SS type A sorting domain-containing protein [Candidatus Cloacimonadota bacterium]
MKKRIFIETNDYKQYYKYKAFVFSLVILISLFTAERAVAQEISIRDNIPWGWIHDFEFYEDGIFISPYDGGIGYFNIDEDYNLIHQYTIDPGGDHVLAQFCVADSFLYALDGAMMHIPGSPVFFIYQISTTGCQFLAGLEPCGTIWAQFDPIIYYDNNVIFQNYPGDYFRIDVSQPSNPILTGSLYSTSDVCHEIITYQDTLLISTRQSGTGFWDGNFRVIENNPPDPLVSLGTYGTNSYTYTSCAVNIGPVLFTSHLDGLRVYDILDLGNVQQIYFYSTAWGRCVSKVGNYIFMGCNNGWHLFEYTSPNTVQHLEFLANDTRVLRMRIKPEANELWCFVDGGTLGGLVVLDVSFGVGFEDNEYNLSKNQISLQNYPNPFNPETAISFSLAKNAKDAKIEIFNIKGQKIRQYSIFPEQSQAPYGAGNNQYSIIWDGTDENNQPVCSGIYFYKLEADGYSCTRKMILLK